MQFYRSTEKHYIYFNYGSMLLNNVLIMAVTMCEMRFFLQRTWMTCQINPIFFFLRLVRGTYNFRYHFMETNVSNLVTADVNGGKKIRKINQF